MTTPPLDLTALREIAKAATPGPWVSIPGAWGGDGYIDRAAQINGEPEIAVCDYDADRDHIAAFGPPTALALLDRVEAAGASIDRARVEVMAGEHAESCARRYAWAPDNCTCWKNAMLTALGWSNQ